MSVSLIGVVGSVRNGFRKAKNLLAGAAQEAGRAAVCAARL